MPNGQGGRVAGRQGEGEGDRERRLLWRLHKMQIRVKTAHISGEHSRPKSGGQTLSLAARLLSHAVTHFNSARQR